MHKNMAFALPKTGRDKVIHRGLRSLRLYTRWHLACLFVLWLIPTIMAEDPWMRDPILNCSSITDNYVGNAQIRFKFADWINRGLCIRKGTSGGGPEKTFQCYSRLQSVIANNLNDIRKAEYGGAAGVLALLPTIGALLGTPTNEIWRLLTMIPFGGVLAMFCSFGGAILPVKAKDYESDFMKKNITGHLRGGKSTLALPTTVDAANQERIKNRADILMKRVQRKLENDSKEKVPAMYILVGLSGMTALLASAQVAMIVVELGAILPWWCISNWWVHLWYLMVILSAAVDNYVQLPFEKQWKLCLSDVPYDLSVTGGDFLADNVAGNEIESMKKSLGQLKSLKTGTLQFTGIHQRTARSWPRNVLFVMVSVTSHSHTWRKTFIRSLSKITSIAVFIVGTACFASAQLLSIAMATFVLTCVLGAGVFGRAITSWIVTGIETADPMIHFVADTTEEAYYVLARLFTIGPTDASAGPLRAIQIEMHGHVFLDQRRITRRSPWPSRVLGILARPYDLARAVYKRPQDDGHYDLESIQVPKTSGVDTQPLMRPTLTANSTFGSDASGAITLSTRSFSRTSAAQKTVSTSSV